MTADMVFVVGMKRREKDAGYHGLATQSTLPGINYTRGGHRVYCFVHDLTSAVELPPGGKDRDRGLQLGVPRSCIVQKINNAEVKHQLFY